MVSPVIVVSGTPSVSTWRNWTAEDLDAADAKWAGWYEAKTAVDHAAERMDEDAFDRLVSADAVDHTAKLSKVDGVTRLLVDGKVAVPTAYRSKSSFGEDAHLETFAGGAVVREGVKLVVKTISMGGRDGEKRRYWTRAGFDAAGAVRDIKDALRIAPDALCILGLSCNAYPDFSRVEHPDEVWRLEDGTQVKGTSGSCVATYDDMGVKDTNRWPWVSYASPAWRGAIKANIRSLVSELRRTGLAKRIVGLHLSGYHDGQFFSPYPDFSDCAKAEYERYLKESPPVKYEYEAFSRQLGFRAQEDFAHEFKAAMGKVLARFASDGAPALAIREDGGCRRVYVCEPGGLSPGLFNRLARESGAYVPVSGGGLEVDMDGDFVSLHALRTGEWDFTLPFPCRVVNAKAGGQDEQVSSGRVHLSLTAGETCCFRLRARQRAH